MMHRVLFILFLALPALLAAGLLARTLLSGPRGDVASTLAWYLTRVYSRIVHRVKFDGLEHVPRARAGMPSHGPLLIVANHSAGVDPLLLQSAMGFAVSWMMLRDMMVPWAGALWKWCAVIPVGPGNSRAAREAIRVLREGGAVGIFPEGGIERPPRVLMPFEPGVGLIVHRSGAPVLLAVIEGTPDVSHAYQSLLRTSRARVRFLPMVNYQNSGLNAADIARDLQARMQQATGWPVRPGEPR